MEAGHWSRTILHPYEVFSSYESCPPYWEHIGLAPGKDHVEHNDGGNSPLHQYNPWSKHHIVYSWKGQGCCCARKFPGLTDGQRGETRGSSMGPVVQ